MSVQVAKEGIVGATHGGEGLAEDRERRAVAARGDVDAVSGEGEAATLVRVTLQGEKEYRVARVSPAAEALQNAGRTL